MLREKTKELFIGESIKDTYAGRMRATVADRVVAAMMAEAPEALWRMDEASGLPQDVSGNGNHMTAANGGDNRVYRVPGPFGGAYGVAMQGGVNFSRNVVTTVTDNWALAMWYRHLVFGGGDTMFVNGTRGAAGFGIDVGSTGTKFRALFGGVAFLDDSANSLSTSAWQYVVVTRESGTTKYYFNGAVDDSNAGTQTPNTPTTKTQIGSDGAAAGIWSICAVYDVALTSAQVAAHYAASGL